MPKPAKVPNFDPNVIHDRHSLYAEIKRRGMTLTGIAQDAGLEGSIVRHGIDRRNRTGAEAIAAALGWSFEYAFPDYHNRGHNSDANLSLKKAKESRQNSTNVVDGRAA
jgi:Ner family transcriptional regulator